MTAVRNHVAVPFFDRVPLRAKSLVLVAFDNILERAFSQREALHHLSNALREINVEGPTSTEFGNWYNRVANGLIERPHPSEVLPFAAPAAHRAETFSNAVPCEVENEICPYDRLEMARDIILAAHVLNEAKIAAGYSPASIILDDTIVQQALIELLEAEATSAVMDADVHMTPGNKLVDLLLGEDSTEVDGKLVDCLTMDMQPELCRILSRTRENPTT